LKTEALFPSKCQGPSGQKQAAVPDPVRHRSGPVLSSAWACLARRRLTTIDQLPVHRTVGEHRQWLTGRPDHTGVLSYTKQPTCLPLTFPSLLVAQTRDTLDRQKAIRKPRPAVHMQLMPHTQLSDLFV